MDWAAQAQLDGATAVVRRIGDRWVVGGGLAVDGGQQAAIWTSADGLAWGSPTLLEPQPPPMPDDIAEREQWFPDRYWVTELAEWRGSLYAVGQHNFGCCDGLAAMLWRSDDKGSTWAIVETAATSFGDLSHAPTAAWVTPDDELAIFSITGLGGGASMFVTGDLETWTEHPIEAFEAGANPSGLVASPDVVLAVGTRFTYPAGSDPVQEQVVWRSTDGRSWASVDPPLPQGRLSAAAWDEAREQFVLVGTDADGRPMAWVGRDGQSWSASSLATEDGSVNDVSASDGVIAAVGVITLSPDQGRTLVWTSHDGLTWWVVRLADDYRGGSVAVSGGSAVVALSSVDEDRWDAWAGHLAE